MKNGAIFTNGFFMTDGTINQVNELKAHFSEMGVAISDIKSNSIPVYLATDAPACRIGDFDFVIFLDKDVHLSHLFEKAGYRLFNSASAIELCDDKIKTYIALTNSGVKMPITISSPVMYRDVTEDSFTDTILDILSFPIVVKNAYGSLGTGVFLVNNREELSELRQTLKFRPHLYQEAIVESFGTDVRIICLGGKAIAAMKRENKHDFRSNLELGGKGYRIEPDKKDVLAAETCAKVLGLDYCGVDILHKNGESIVCEVNSNAFFKGVTLASGVDIGKKYAEYVYNKVYFEKNA